MVQQFSVLKIYDRKGKKCLGRAVKGFGNVHFLELAFEFWRELAPLTVVKLVMLHVLGLLRPNISTNMSSIEFSSSTNPHGEHPRNAC